MYDGGFMTSRHTASGDADLRNHTVRMDPTQYQLIVPPAALGSRRLRLVRYAAVTYPVPITGDADRVREAGPATAPAHVGAVEPAAQQPLARALVLGSHV